MDFDLSRYLSEMQLLVAIGCIRLAVSEPRVRVYSVSIWTDPDARISAISFDTLANSRRKVAARERFRMNAYAKVRRQGQDRLAKLLAKPGPDRNVNPADFAFREFHEISHRAMPVLWEERAGRDCWKVLEPALRTVAKQSLPLLAELNLEPAARLGINSKRDWFDATWAISAV